MMKKVFSIIMATIMLFSVLSINATAKHSNLTYSASEVDAIEEQWINHGYVLKKSFARNTRALVRPLQTMLRDLDYNVSVDGIYGSQTASAVRKFQADFGLSADGIFGKNSRIMLLHVYRSQMNDSAFASSDSTSTMDTSNMKSYNSSFWIVDSYNKKYLFDQTDYTCFPGSQSGKIYSGCTAVSVCSMLSMSKSSIVYPEDYAEKGWTTAGCNWNGCKMIGLATGSTKDRLKDLVENYILEDVPVSFWANKYHMVLVLGVRKNADVNNLKASDILIMDPWGAQITTLDQSQRGGYTLTKFKAYISK